jgi:hypothetical protein
MSPPFRRDERCCRPLAIAALLLLGAALPAGAQPAPWRFDFDVSFSSMRGNQDMLLWNSSLRLRHSNPDLLSFDLQLRGRYGVSESEGERERAQEFYRADYRVDLLPGALGPYAETRVQHDPFRDRRVMVNSGAGARYRMSWAEDDGEATVRLAVIHSYEDPFDDPATQRARWNMEADGRQEVFDGVVLRHSTKYQPLYHFDDYLLSLDTRLTVRITDRLGLLMRHEFERDTDPPARSPNPDDTVITAGISVSF